ncbi:porin [Vibrio sp. Y2-5]|uniref:porin n=1 Tax=Vibrio sp. Y2-5 TaxID=2743977 RepID=UPI0016610993|nr:porin [Vibrio sp. Y2-5]MBD0786984.1 porin [Vibrio sp. Y2-5]
MKKTLLALAVLAAAGSVNAANLYENDATAVNISGEIDALYKDLSVKSGGANYKNTDGALSAWANVQFDIDHKLSDAVTAFGSFEIEGDNGSTTSVDDAFVGFKGAFGKVKIGETGSSYALLEKAELTNEGADTDLVYNSTESDGHGIRYEITVADNLYLSADYQTTKDANKGNDWAVGADYSIGDFTIGLAYQQADEDAVTYNRNAVGTSVAYEANGLYVAATYSQYEGQGDVNVEGGDTSYDLGDHDGNTAALAASYSFSDYKVYGAYQTIMADKTTSGANLDADIKNWYVGVEYAVMANLTAFAEYNAAELSGSDVAAKQEMDFMAAGLYLTF